MFAKIENNIVVKYPIIDIRSELPNISFSWPVTQEQLPEEYVVVQYSEKPSDTFDSNVIEGIPIYDSLSNTCYQTWVEVPCTEAEMQIKYEYLRISNKNKAKDLLKESDWTQLNDINILNLSEYNEYRGILREIYLNTKAEHINWPIEPTPIWA